MPFFKARQEIAETATSAKAGAMIAACLLCVCVVDWSILHQGLPALRHDWHMPSVRDALGSTLAGYFEPWIEQGLGSAQPYPTFYLLGFVLWPLHFILGPLGVTLIILTSAVAICAASAFTIATSRGVNALGAAGITLFAALNPWVYCEYVAGHIFMVFAYALLLALLAETSRRAPRDWVLIVLSGLLITQIEFFVIAVIPFSVWCTRRRSFRPLGAILVAAAPIAVGIVALFSQILATPYNLAWQSSQSVPLGKGSILLGYQFGYGAEFERVRFVLIAYALIAVIGAWVCLRNRRDVTVLALSVACLFFATGTTSWFAPLYRQIVLNVTESGIFRELYDLIALVAVGYVVGLSAAARHRAAPAALVVLAAALVVPWVSHPVSSYLVNGGDIPVPQFDRAPGTRVALLPAFQPLQFKGRGSGYDPDAYVRTGFAVPINESFPSFPAENALAAFANTGDLRALSALGVSQIIARPYLQTNRPLLSEQTAFSLPRKNALATSRRLAHSFPLVTAYPRPPTIVSIGNSPAEYAIFLGDAPAGDARFISLMPSRTTANPARDWIDARLAYVARPQWGTAFGGIATASRKRLDLPPKTVAILAETTGTLLDDRRRTIATAATDLHWFPTPESRSIECRGICVIALAANTPIGDVPEHAFNPDFTAVPFDQVTPWLVTVAAPRSAETLRYNVTFSRFWIAIAGSQILKHERLDESVNAWNVARIQGSRIYLLNSLAAAQLVLEFLAFFTIAAAAAAGYYKSRRT